MAKSKFQIKTALNWLEQSNADSNKYYVTRGDVDPERQGSWNKSCTTHYLCQCLSSSGIR